MQFAKQFSSSPKPQLTISKARLPYRIVAKRDSKPFRTKKLISKETFLYQFPFLLTFPSIYRSYRIIKVIMLTDVNIFQEEKEQSKKSCSLKIIGSQ
jgi:hypothetical protein